jgi:hypothetical protein
MSNKDQTLPGGFQGAEHPLGEDRAQTSTPPPDSRQSFDPYEFGAHTVSPSLRMELIKTQLPETPAERLYHSPASEARKTSSPVAASGAARDAAKPATPIRFQLARFRREIVLATIALVAALGVVSLQRGCAKEAAPKIEVAVVSSKQIEDVAASLPHARVEPAASTALPAMGAIREVAASPASSAKATDDSAHDSPNRRRSVVLAPSSVSSANAVLEPSVQSDPIIKKDASPTTTSTESNGSSNTEGTPIRSPGSVAPPSSTPPAPSRTSGKPSVNFLVAPQ